VADTIDGRFEMVTLMLSLVLIRLESDDDAGKAPSVHLTEIFVDDMDGQLREIGIGDVVVGKHIGRMMSALGGRLGAYRATFADPGAEAAQEATLTRNLYRGEAPAPAAMAVIRAGLRVLIDEMARAPLDALLKGRLVP
jgi:cytochrome b pre-mRNA-processing protein 3